MHWPKSLLHVVRRNEIRDTCKRVQESILVAKHWSRTDNGGLWEDTSDYLFAASLDDSLQNRSGRAYIVSHLCSEKF